jgi:hypothetical protein
VFPALCILLTSNALAKPDAYQIFEHAKRVLQSQSYPDPISYRTTIQVSEGNKDEFEHFLAEAFVSGDVRVEGVSDEEQATPHQTRGMNFKLSFSIGWNTEAGGQTETVTKDAHRTEASPDYLGVPLISPAYFFGLTTRHAAAPNTASPTTSGLHTIATVTAIDRVYMVSLVGTEEVGALYAYHLHLKPITHPDWYRIRDLWVDVYTYQVVQLQIQGNFTNAPMTNVAWLVTFQNVDGNAYIQRETALEPLVFHHDRTFTAASIGFTDIHASDTCAPILPTLDGPSDINLREPEALPI